MNKFDGHEFIPYTNHDTEFHIPFDFISDLVISPDCTIWLVGQNAIALLNPQNNDINKIQIDSRSAIYDQSFSLNGFCFDKENQIRLISHLDEYGKSYLHKSSKNGQLVDIFECQGNYINRAIIRKGNHYFLSYKENSLLEINEKGEKIKEFNFPLLKLKTHPTTWINQIQFTNGSTLWVLFNNGQVFYLQQGDSEFQLHPNVIPIDHNHSSSLLVEDNSESGKVNISCTTYKLVKEYFKCNHREKVTAKNKGEIDMYFVESPYSA